MTKVILIVFSLTPPGMGQPLLMPDMAACLAVMPRAVAAHKERFPAVRFQAQCVPVAPEQGA